MVVNAIRSLPIPELYIEQLRNTEQNPRFHAEGNVLNHTLMVLDQYYKHVDEFELTQDEREVLYWAAVLHDVGKPRVSRLVNGRWVARGHEAAGVPVARNILLGMPEISHSQRRRILNIVRWHHVPMRWGLMGTRYSAYKWLSTQTDIRLLGIFALFDVLGRICVNKSHVLEVIDHFNEVIVPRIHHEFGSHEEIQHFFDTANYNKKNALWHALKTNDFRLMEKVLYRRPEQEREPHTSCVITIGPPKSGKTRFLKEQFPEHEYIHLSEEACEPGSQSQLETQLCRLRKALAHPLGEKRKVAIDGSHLDVSWRKRVMEYARECGATIRYLFFEKSLDEIRINNQLSARPMSENQLQAAYNQLYFPHPWEAHHLQLVT
ncbi:MAG: HD domain-containing protein [Bacteroidetes bacterium]|nr:MAG: HD domain-containing protein [Bacteroidota bacterium]